MVYLQNEHILFKHGQFCNTYYHVTQYTGEINTSLDSVRGYMGSLMCHMGLCGGLEAHVNFLYTGHDSNALELDHWPIKAAVGRSVENAGSLLIYYTCLSSNNAQTFELCYAKTGRYTRYGCNRYFGHQRWVTMTT